jgi:sugar phosphate isomerase/epimerase
VLKTRTGGFPIGYRMVCRTDWSGDSKQVKDLNQTTGLAFVDVDARFVDRVDLFRAADIPIGSVDLPNPADLASSDAGIRSRALDTAERFISNQSSWGNRILFCVVTAGSSEMSRPDAFAYAVKGYTTLNGFLEKHDCWLVMEGVPNGLASTPESYRELISRCGDRLSVNYDPSHLIRMGIDPIRFVREFASSVRHVHGKDTEIFPEAYYETGHQVSSVLGHKHEFGGTYWRYTIPGHGCARWTEAFSILEQAGYDGGVSIELEDENFNGTAEGEKLALTLAGQFLAGA